ncbi:MAG: asparagine synthase [Paucibacter sp.]|nr:asparagine synthase [Roseateles sp.]
MSLKPLFLGSPRFATSEARALASAGNMEEAWRLTLTDGIHAGLAQVGGDFALALELADGRWLLASDRFGIRSLCYRLRDGALEFAARADALADKTPFDLQALYDYLYFHVIPAPRTVFDDVHRLPPAHCALVEAGRSTVAAYWTPSFAPDRAASLSDLKAEFTELLEQAVRRQLDANPACFLSGGTDSSTVAGMMARVSGGPVQTYSIGFDAAGYDEIEYARIAARRFGTQHHEHYVTPDDLVRWIPHVAQSYDQPFGNSSALPTFLCASMAREHGVTKLLAGDGGDELFGGNTRYAKQKVFSVYDHVPAPLRRGLLEPLAGIGAVQRVPLVRKVASYVNQAKVGMPDRMMSYNLLDRLGHAEVFAEGFLAAVDVQEPLRHQRDQWQRVQSGTIVDRMLAYDWRYTLADCDLPKVVGTTALAGVDVGFPLLDDDLLAFSMRLPASYKVRDLKLRWFFKEALRGFLPDEIITKKKHGFGLPFGVWAHRHAGLNALASDSLHSLAGRGIVREAFVRDLLERRLAEHPGFYGEMVWLLLMLEQWLGVHRPDFRL